jgi:hypothetical protein
MGLSGPAAAAQPFGALRASTLEQLDVVALRTPLRHMKHTLELLHTFVLQRRNVPFVVEDADGTDVGLYDDEGGSGKVANGGGGKAAGGGSGGGDGGGKAAASGGAGDSAAAAKVPKVKPTHKRILLCPTQCPPGAAELPPTVAGLLQDATLQPPITVVPRHPMRIGFGAFGLAAALRRALPEDVSVPQAFETVGHIARLNLRDPQWPHRYIIGAVIAQVAPGVRTVVAKSSKIGCVEEF